MSSATSMSAKLCCACGADVSGKPRMKDSHSRYWCVPCGEADQRRKQAIAGTHELCAGCRQQFAIGKLEKHGDYFYCKGCAKSRSRAGVPSPTASGAAPGGSGLAAAVAAASAAHISPVRSSSRASMGSTTDKKRLMIMATLLAVLILISLLFNFVFV